MTDTELEAAYHAMMVKRLQSPKVVYTPNVVPTGKFYTQPCDKCNGSGRMKCGNLGGWVVVTRYQDGSEASEPMSEQDAIREFLSSNDKYNTDLISPTGNIYKVDEQNEQA